MLKIFTENIDPSVKSKLYDIAKSGIYDHIRVMPDVHEGSSIVGFTAHLKDKLSPDVIGPDIGCGMLCVNLGKLDINLELFDHRLRKVIPSGFDVCEKKDKYYSEHTLNLEELHCYKGLKNIPELERAMGTLGGGNHFVELDTDSEDNIYLVIHTGSRNLGKQVWSYYKNKTSISGYLEGQLLENYLNDCEFCNRWAKTNRSMIATKLLDAMNIRIKNIRKQSFDTPHNYISVTGLIRKGAIKCDEGRQVIIPINMRDGCIIGTGLGNDDWNFSGPHGAGRLFSRNEAKKLITLDEYKQSMEGIYTTSITENTIDESPMAYKNMEEIISLIGDTVKIEKIIKPIYNFKHSS